MTGNEFLSLRAGDVVLDLNGNLGTVLSVTPGKTPQRHSISLSWGGGMPMDFYGAQSNWVHWEKAE